MAVSYRRVATSDHADDASASARNRESSSSSGDDDANSSSSPLRSRSERISDKLHARECLIACYLPFLPTDLRICAFFLGPIVSSRVQLSCCFVVMIRLISLLSSPIQRTIKPHSCMGCHRLFHCILHAVIPHTLHR
jgi:hypothetical protein